MFHQGDHMRRPLLLLSVAASFALLAFLARPEKRMGAASFSDREIFEGVVFGVGPVVNLVPEARDQLRPEIYARSADQLAEISAVRAELIAAIERAEPTFIGEFGRVARSGDPAAIRVMLERAEEAVDRAAAEERHDLLDGTLFANIPSPQLGPTTRPRPGPTSPQLFANIPSPQLGPTTRPRPAPTSPPLVDICPSQQLGPTTRPRPGPTSPQLVAQPGWALFSSELFSEQLAASMAVQLERSRPAEG